MQIPLPLAPDHPASSSGASREASAPGGPGLAAPSAVEDALLAIPLETMTPMDAMAALHELREQLRKQRAEAQETPQPGKVVRMKRKQSKQPR